MRWADFAARRAAFSPERVLLLAGSGLAVSLLGDAAIYIVVPTHTAEAGILLSDVGLMLSANRIIRIFLNSPYGVAIERLPRRPVLIVSLLLGVIANLLYVWSGFWPMLIGRLVWGVAWAGIWMGGSTLVLDIASDTNRGRFVGRYQMWFFIGAGGCSLLGGLLTDWLGYHAMFAFGAVVMLLMTGVWWLFLPETRPHNPHTLSADSPDSADPADPAPSQPAPGTAPKRRGRLPLLAAIALLGLNWLIFLGIAGAVMPLLLQERVGQEIWLFSLLIPLSTFTGALVAGNQVVSLLVSPVSGWFSDRSGNRWGLVVLALVLGILSLSLSAVGWGGVVVAATMLSAVTTSALQTQVITLVGDYARPNRQGRFLGLLNTAGDLGSATGPLLAFAVLPVVGIIGVFALSAVLLVLALPAVLLIAWRELYPRAL